MRRAVTELGVFTTGADVLCYEHGVEARAIPPHIAIKHVARDDEDFAIGHCDRCGKKIRVRHDIAELQAINLALGELGEMLQLGGMTAGLLFAVPGTSEQIIVTGFGPALYIGRFHDYFSGEEEEGYRYEEHDSVEDAVHAVERLSDGLVTRKSTRGRARALKRWRDER